MNITTQNDGANIIVEINGQKVAAYDHIEGDLEHARMQAEAHVAGLQQGLKMTSGNPTRTTGEADPSEEAQAGNFLFSWDSEALAHKGCFGILTAVAPDEDTARQMILEIAKSQIEARILRVDLAGIEEDLEMPPVIHLDNAFIQRPDG